MGKGLHKRIIVFLFSGILGALMGCEEDLVPKPPCYLRTNFPTHKYHSITCCGGHSMELADIFNLKKTEMNPTGDCNQEIDLGPINGSLFLFYRKFDTQDSLAKLINISNDRVDEHKIKADRIDFKQLIDQKNHVYGTFFTLKGNVATNFQFYITDSTSKFIRGEVMLNCRPNYDSLRPSLDYLKVDLEKMLTTFRWKK